MFDHEDLPVRLFRRALYLALCFVLVLALGSRAGRWLVVDNPERSDLIVVLAGETEDRPELGLKLLNQHYAPRLILDVPARERVYGSSTAELAARWAKDLPEGSAISTCPIYGLSTRDEAREAAHCIEQVGAHSVTLVTSDFHTRRALSTFRHEVPAMNFSVGAAHTPVRFGAAWWTRREWAKTTAYEWSRFAWWECVDRWRR